MPSLVLVRSWTCAAGWKDRFAATGPAWQPHDHQRTRYRWEIVWVVLWNALGGQSPSTADKSVPSVHTSYRCRLEIVPNCAHFCSRSSMAGPRQSDSSIVIIISLQINHPSRLKHPFANLSRHAHTCLSRSMVSNMMRDIHHRNMELKIELFSSLW